MALQLGEMVCGGKERGSAHRLRVTAACACGAPIAQLSERYQKPFLSSNKYLARANYPGSRIVEDFLPAGDPPGRAAIHNRSWLLCGFKLSRMGAHPPQSGGCTYSLFRTRRHLTALCHVRPSAMRYRKVATDFSNSFRPSTVIYSLAACCLPPCPNPPDTTGRPSSLEKTK